MSEVKRYHVTEAGLVEGQGLGRINVVLGSDYDTAVAVGTALGNTLERVVAERDALQQRLTAADERADVLEADLIKAKEDAANNLSDANNGASLLEEALEWFDDGVGRSPDEFKLMRRIGDWLGRSVPEIKDSSDECAHSEANKIGCPECGEVFKP